MSRTSANQATYVLGSHAEERGRLERQHQIWRPEMLAGWDRAGFCPGQRLLDVGCGPGFASLDLGERVGAHGQVLAIDSAPAYLEHLRQQCQQRQPLQVIPQLGDLAQGLPQRLEARGFRLLHSSSLMACSPSDHPKAQWLIDFLTSYPAQLAALEAELAWALQHASLWLTPALVEMVWERL